jgi:RNA polymerase sigma factor (sigma-70 family)
VRTMSVSETAASAAPDRWIPRGLLGDARLAGLATCGDRSAFEGIFKRYHQELFRYCWAILGDPDEAQDALQSTMASALRALPGEERQIALRPWLYRVAHNEAISILRQRATAIHPHPLPDPLAHGADAHAEGRERLRDLVADLEALPERQRGALLMRELSDLSYGEIGAALAASKAAARQVVYEARVALRELQGGREMECETARRAMSVRDGRLLRGRRLGAHLRTCESCGDFWAGISERRSDLRALCPPLPALAASGLLTTLLGEAGTVGVGATSGGVAGGAASVAVAGGSSSAGAAGAAGTSIAGSAAIKGAAVAAAIVIGAGAADISDVGRLPLVSGRDAPRIERTALATPHGTAARRDANRGPQAHRRQGAAAQASERARGAASRGEPGRGRWQSQGGHGAVRRANESQGTASATHGEPVTNPGNPSATSNGAPPEPPGSSNVSHDNGQAGASDSSHGNAPASPRSLATAAANAPTLPEQAEGQPVSPPGNVSAANTGASPSRSQAPARVPGFR